MIEPADYDLSNLRADLDDLTTYDHMGASRECFVATPERVNNSNEHEGPLAANATAAGGNAEVDVKIPQQEPAMEADCDKF